MNRPTGVCLFAVERQGSFPRTHVLMINVGELNNNSIYNNALIRRVIGLLEDQYLAPKTVSERTGVGIATVYKVNQRLQWLSARIPPETEYIAIADPENQCALKFVPLPRSLARTRALMDAERTSSANRDSANTSSLRIRLRRGHRAFETC